MRPFIDTSCSLGDVYWPWPWLRLRLEVLSKMCTLLHPGLDKLPILSIFSLHTWHCSTQLLNPVFFFLYSSCAGWSFPLTLLLRPLAFFNRINIIHITTSVSRRFNILYLLFKIRKFNITTLFVRLWRLAFYTSNKHLHERIASLREEVWVYKTLPTFYWIVSSKTPKIIGHVYEC